MVSGAVSILPTILYLTTGVLKECAVKGSTDSAVLATTAPVTAALHSLRVLVTDKYTQDSRCDVQWKTLLQSALVKILDLTKSGDFWGGKDSVCN